MEAVARTIARHLNGYKLIVEKSTTPVCTAEQMEHTIRRWASTDHNFDVAVNPEFLREGSALHDVFNPDRIVLGVESSRAKDILLKIYQPLIERMNPNAHLVITNRNTAELIKHAANAFLAMKISFINMVADLGDATGADIAEVAQALGLDPRIGPQFLNAGAGYGGYCLPKDLRAFCLIGEERGVDMPLLRAVDDTNQQRVERLVQKLRKALWVLRGKTVRGTGAL